MDIIFRDKYVNYNQISNTTLMKINEVLLENNILMELGDEFTNDWGAYSYYYCKTLNDFDEPTICSFVYIITWFMTGNPIDIVPNLKSEYYYKNNKIISDCLTIYNDIIYNYDSEIELCKNLFERIYEFYLNNHEKYIKRTERINCLLTYDDLKLFNKVDGESRSDKIHTLLNVYYNLKD